jgi:hypothetical protein
LLPSVQILAGLISHHHADHRIYRRRDTSDFRLIE